MAAAAARPKLTCKTDLIRAAGELAKQQVERLVRFLRSRVAYTFCSRLAHQIQHRRLRLPPLSVLRVGACVGARTGLSWNPNPSFPFAPFLWWLDSLRALRLEEIPRYFSTFFTLPGQARDETIGGDSRLPLPASKVAWPWPSPQLLQTFLLDLFLVLLRRLRGVGGEDEDHNIFQ